MKLPGAADRKYGPSESKVLSLDVMDLMAWGPIRRVDCGGVIEP